MAVAGSVVFLSTLSFMKRPPSRTPRESGYVNALIIATGDLSSGVFWLFNVTNFSLAILFILYGLGLLFPGILFYCYWNLPLNIQTAGREALLQKPEPDSPNSNFFYTSSSQLRPRLPFIEYLKSSQLYVLWLCCTSYICFGYWYISSYREQLTWILGDNEIEEIDSWNNFFSVALPLVGFGSTLLQGYLAGTFSPRVGWIVLGILSAIIGTLSCFKIVQLQYFICILFPFWRLFGFVQVYAHATTFFPPEMFGKLAFGGYTFAGLCGYINVYLDWATINEWNKNYSYVNGGYTILTTFCSFWAAYVSGIKYETKDLPL